MFVIAFCAIIPDLSSAWGVPLIVPMAEYWPDTPDNVGRSLSGNVFVRPRSSPMCSLPQSIQWTTCPYLSLRFLALTFLPLLFLAFLLRRLHCNTVLIDFTLTRWDIGLTVDAWSRRSHCSPIYSTIRSTSSPLVEYVYVPIHDIIRNSCT